MKILFWDLRIVYCWLGSFCHLAGARRVRAAPQDVTITVTTLDDEYLNDGDCSPREAFTPPITTRLTTNARPATASAWTPSSLRTAGRS